MTGTTSNDGISKVDTKVPPLKPDDLTIRPAQRGDFEGITALFNKGEKTLFAPVFQSNIPKSIRKKFEGEDPNYFCLVAIFANEIVGQTSLKRLGSKGLLMIIVDESYRGCGIGTALLSNLITAARRTFDRIEVDVFKTNDPALRLYRGLGFQVEERPMNDDAIVTMSKSIA